MEIKEIHQLFLKSAGVSTDTRKIKKNTIFFALRGENFNANQFALAALEAGAAYAVIDEDQDAADPRLILVPNVLKSLQELATYHRQHCGIPVIGLTGSNGKTTTKELINSCLSRKYRTVATLGNLNNHIGVPLTLLNLSDETEIGIIEMGANHPGEIAFLCSIAQPDFGYITNFGKAHLEGFGSVEGVIKAKSELYDHLKNNGKLLFLNIDDTVQQQNATYPNIYTFGNSNAEADVKVEYPITSKTAEVRFNGDVFSSVLTGSYNSVNIAAAICIGNYFKVPQEAIQKAIAAYTPTNNRSQLVTLGNNTLVMDAYNANPTSMRAALDSFQNYPADKKWVILGDMFELGASSDVEHQEIESLVEKMDLEKAILIGKNFSKVKTTGENISSIENFQDLEAFIKQSPPEHCHILVKGSRGMALERVQDMLKALSI